MGHYLYWEFYQTCIHLQIGVGICTVLTADAVAIDEVNCYNVTV